MGKMERCSCRSHQQVALPDIASEGAYEMILRTPLIPKCPFRLKLSLAFLFPVRNAPLENWGAPCKTALLVIGAYEGEVQSPKGSLNIRITQGKGNPSTSA